MAGARFCHVCGRPVKGAAPAGERRVVTCLFCDVRGSTALAEELDPEEWTELMNTVFERLTGPVERYEGTVARLMGDAILAFFGAPVAHEDDPRRAILAGLDIVAGVATLRDARAVAIDVRVGINTGLVVVGEVGSDERVEYTAMGDAVNLAARMEQTAAPGTVQVTEATRRLTAADFNFEELGALAVKGKQRPVEAFRVVGRRRAAAHPAGAPLVGRKRELERLRGALDRLRDGRGAMAWISAEPGLGKSRLLAEVRTHWEGDWEERRGVSYETARPYGLFWSEVEPVLAGGGSPEEVKRAFRERTLAFWRARAGAQAVLCLDDLHWADPASVELLRELRQVVKEAALLILCASRLPPPMPVDLDLRLGPLDASASLALARSLVTGNGTAELVERSGGNPLFLEQLAAAVREDAAGELPAGLQSLLLARIDRLSERARRTLHAASVLGREFTAGSLAALVTGSDLGESLDDLVQAGLVHARGGGGFAFRHALIQEAAYGSVLLRTRRGWHRQAAASLEEAAQPAPPALIAHHYDLAGDPRAVTWLLRAGDEAARLHASVEAAEHYGRALAIADAAETDVALLGRLYLGRGNALELLGDYKSALAVYAEMEALGRSRGDARLELDALAVQAKVRATPTAAHDVRLAVRLLKRAVDLARQIDDRETESRLLWNQMLASHSQPSQRRHAIGLGERSLALARELGLTQQEAFTLNDLHFAYLAADRLADARRALAQALPLWERLDTRPMVATWYASTAYLDYLAGRYGAALKAARRGRRLSDEIGNLWGVSYSLRAVGLVEFERGADELAIAAMEECVRIGEQAGLMPVLIGTRADLGLALAEQGQVETGVELCETALAKAKGALATWSGWPGIQLSRTLIRAGRLDEAGRRFEAAAAVTGGFPAGFAWSIAGPARVELAIARGDFDAAQEAAQAFLDRVRRVGVHGHEPEALRLLAEALEGLGRKEEAAVQRAGARRLAARIGAGRVLRKL